MSTPIGTATDAAFVPGDQQEVAGTPFLGGFMSEALSSSQACSSQARSALALTIAELDEQRAELLPHRTVLSMLSGISGGRGGEGGLGGPGGVGRGGLGANLININLFGDQTNPAGTGYGGVGGAGDGGAGGAVRS
ncbi:MAG: hypothetical protein ACRDTX_08440 [Pseudonocardiaceae bacterium]